MHVRIKITLLFSFIMSVLLAFFCGFIYYFFYSIRLENVKAHLTNHVVTTANMLNRPRTFNQDLIKKIDSITEIPMKNKTIQVYNSGNERIYANSDVQNDTLHVTDVLLNNARMDKKYFFTVGNREAIAYSLFKNASSRINRPVTFV